MWKLKVGEGGGPWLRSTNGFLGRTVWEFDPVAGTPEERAEVERARREFADGRFGRRESADLLLRLQLGKQNDQTGKALPPWEKRLEEEDEVTEEMVLRSLRRALDQMAGLQVEDGCWPGDFSGVMFIMPALIFALYVTGSLDAVLTAEHRREICRYIYNHQNEDGGWGTLILGSSSMFGTCSNYITLRLLGHDLDGNAALEHGRGWILSRGGATLVPQWGKILLSVVGVYDWSGNNPIFPELWLLPQFLPFHPGRFWCLCRMMYLPMAYLYGKKFVGPITPIILAIREEIYNVSYHEIEWGQSRNACAKEDLLCPHTMLQNLVWTALYKCVEPVLSSWPINKLCRETALDKLMEHIHYEDENTQYLCICAVNKALNMMCCWAQDPHSDAFKLHLARVPDFLWLSEDGMKAQVYDNCQSWETSFIIQAFCATDLGSEYGPTLERANAFMKTSQVLWNHPGDSSETHRHRSKGSWTLSSADNGWAVSDTTAEALQALLLLSDISSNLVRDPIEIERVHDAVDCLLSFVNKDGTFSTYECSRTSAWIEILNPCESFPNIIVDYPYPECTSSVLQALALFNEMHPGYRTREIKECIRNAATFIESTQGSDGSWLGTWGVCFTYAAFFSVKGLVAAGRTYENSSSIRKACRFLLSKQLSAGGWGESHVSNRTKVYVNLEGDRANAVNTAWAMLTLLYGGQMDRDPTPLHRAAKELINMQMNTGEFPQQEHIGCFNCSLFFNYANFRNLFPIWALGEYRHRLHAKAAKGWALSS